MALCKRACLIQIYGNRKFTHNKSNEVVVGSLVAEYYKKRALSIASREGPQQSMVMDMVSIVAQQLHSGRLSTNRLSRYHRNYDEIDKLKYYWCCPGLDLIQRIYKNNNNLSCYKCIRHS